MKVDGLWKSRRGRVLVRLSEGEGHVIDSNPRSFAARVQEMEGRVENDDMHEYTSVLPKRSYDVEMRILGAGQGALAVGKLIKKRSSETFGTGPASAMAEEMDRRKDAAFFSKIT